MKRTTINFIVDTIAFIGMILLTTTGILTHYLLPKGSGTYLTIWGLSRHEWGGIHFWVALIFIAMSLLHIMLHWSWIVCIIKGKGDKFTDIRIMGAIITFLVILVLAVAPLISPVVNSKDGQNYGREKKGNRLHDIGR